MICIDFKAFDTVSRDFLFHTLVSFGFGPSFLQWTGLLVGCGKKSQNSRDFQGQIRRKKGRCRRNFAGIFEADFAEKRSVKNGRFLESFPSKFRWKAIGFALI